jgi:trimeric autotransporter adhesin
MNPIFLNPTKPKTEPSMKNDIRSTRNRLSSLAATVALLLLTSGLALAQTGNTSYGVRALISNTTGNNNSAFGEMALTNNTTGNYNTAIGNRSLLTNTTGSFNVAVGFDAAFSNTSGIENTAIGRSALYKNTIGNYNSALGTYALLANTTGSLNSANGHSALMMNTEGWANAASGAEALRENITGSENSAVGEGALSRNTTGDRNTAVGRSALYYNASASNNVGVGYLTLFYNTGNFNSAIGSEALAYSTTGTQNTATGYQSLQSNTTGDNNTASGSQSLSGNKTGWGNTGIGFQALGGMISGHNNLALGYKAGLSLTGDNNIAIMNSGVAGESNVIRIGEGQSKAFIAGISGVKVSGGVQVFINANGQLGTLTSSQRFKDNIKTIDADSEKLQQLRPVSFLYKDSAESGKHTLQYGLIAEEVAKVYPELVQYDEDGKPFTVYYHLLTPLLLSQIQQQQFKIAKVESELEQQKQEHAAQIAALERKLMQFVETKTRRHSEKLAANN